MIRGELFDAGTKLVYDTRVPVPGMDVAYYREIDMEYDWPQERTDQINASIVAADSRVELRPWPEPFPGNMWIDYHEYNRGEDGGFQFHFYHRDQYNPTIFDKVPLDLTQIEDPANIKPSVSRRWERMSDSLNEDEIADRTEPPTEFIRQPLGNESAGTTDLRNPAVIMQRAHEGARFVPTLNYSPLYMPFDFRYPERYVLLGEDGSNSPADVAQFLTLSNNAHYRLYLLPAKWRWVATVKAYYYYVSWFEFFLTNQIFTKAWFSRPPIYTRRHDVVHSAGRHDIEYEHNWYAWDAGVNDGFDRSRGSATLRTWIIDAQWWTYSEAYVFARNDDVTMVLWLHPPDVNDIVCGIGRVDHPSGKEERVWVKQKVDLSSEYPNTVMGQWYVPFAVAT